MEFRGFSVSECVEALKRRYEVERAFTKKIEERQRQFVLKEIKGDYHRVTSEKTIISQKDGK